MAEGSKCKKKQRAKRQSSGARKRSRARALATTLKKGFARRVKRVKELYSLILYEESSERLKEVKEGGPAALQRHRLCKHHLRRELLRVRFNTTLAKAKTIFQEAEVPWTITQNCSFKPPEGVET